MANLPSIPDGIPQGDAGIRMLLGILMGQMEDMRDDYNGFREESRDEHRKVHIILDADGEARRNMARDIAEIKPIVKEYEMKASYINEAVELSKAYRKERDEKEGMRKIVVLLYGALVILAGAVGSLFSMLAEHFLKLRATLDTTFSFLV